MKASQGAGRDRRKWLVVAGGLAAFVVVGLALAPGVVRHRPPAAEPTAASDTTPERPSRATRASAGDVVPPAARPRPTAAVVDDMAFDCMIAANAVIDVGSPIAGVLEDIPVERSDYVEAGDVLAQLESSVEQASAAVAEARARQLVEVAAKRTSLELGENRQDRAERLFESESLSLDMRQQVETEARLAALELELAEENRRLASLRHQEALASLERRTIRSPISGYVIERLMEPGEVVDEETILRVAQVDPLRVEAILPSEWFGRVHEGDTAEVVPEAPRDQSHRAEVAIVDRIIDGASGTFGVRLELPNADHALPVGLRCQLRFLPAEHAAASAPGAR